MGNSLRWDDLRWLRSLTTLPILLKGIQHPMGVRRAKDYGVAGSIAPTTAAARPIGGLPALEPYQLSSRPPTECRAVRLRSYASAPTWPSPGAWATAVGVRSAVCLMHCRGRHRRQSYPTARHLAERDLLMAIDGFRTIADLLHQR